MEHEAKAKAVARVDSAREERVNAAEVSGRVARRKLLEIGLHKGAALPAAVAAGSPAAPHPNLRLEQVHEKRADTRQRKPRGHAPAQNFRSSRKYDIQNLSPMGLCASFARAARAFESADLYFELSMICCAFLIADSSGALSFFRMSIAFCAEAMASFLLPSLA